MILLCILYVDSRHVYVHFATLPLKLESDNCSNHYTICQGQELLKTKQDLLRGCSVFDCWYIHELTNNTNCIGNIWTGQVR